MSAQQAVAWAKSPSGSLCIGTDVCGAQGGPLAATTVGSSVAITCSRTDRPCAWDGTFSVSPGHALTLQGLLFSGLRDGAQAVVYAERNTGSVSSSLTLIACIFLGNKVRRTLRSQGFSGTGNVLVDSL